MNTKYLYKIILFLILIIVIDRTLGFYILKFALKYKHDKRIELVINNELDKELMILGSSRVLNGLSPSVIEQQTGLTSFNMGVSGTNIVFHETILDLLLKSTHIPKIIIYNIDDPATLYNFDDLVIYKLEELFPYVYNDNINRIVSEHLDKENWVTYLSSTYKNNVNFMSAIKYLTRGHEAIAPEINNIDNYGSVLMDGRQIGMENIKFLETYPYTLDEEYKPYILSLQHIISKCKKNNIQLIMVIPPIYFNPNKEFNKRIKQLANNECVVLDYSGELRDKQFFYNHGHLNKNGAIHFSEMLSKDILKINK